MSRQRIPPTAGHRVTQEDVNGEKLTVKKRWIFGADFFTVWCRFFHSLRRFFTVCKGRKRWKKKTSRYRWAFSRLVFHSLPPLESLSAPQRLILEFISSKHLASESWVAMSTRALCICTNCTSEGCTFMHPTSKPWQYPLTGGGGRSKGLRPEKVFPRIYLPKFWAKFGWTFWGEFLLQPFVLWIEGPNCSENSWEGFGWFFAI